MRLLITSWAMPGTLSFLYFWLGGELCHFLLLPFKVKFSQSGATLAVASTAARGSLPPIPA
jgi:hypothetical protein